MVHYKLYYFNFRGLAEPARMMFHMANIEFEDIRIPFEEFEEFKKVAPFTKVPLLEIDGQILPQSLAICRFVARKVGLAGKSDYEVALADAISEQFSDYFAERKPWRMMGAPYGDADEETREKCRREVLIPISERFAGFMVEYLKKSPTGFLAGGGLTYADLLLSEWTLTNTPLIPEAFVNYPELDEHMKKVHAVPELQKWLKERPQTQF